MIKPPDELLEDLQSALPPEQVAKSPTPRVIAAAEAIRKSPSPTFNGQTSPSYDPLEVKGPMYDEIDDMPKLRASSYEMPIRGGSAERESRDSTLSQQFDDAMYSEVRKGPRYVPKSHSPSPHPTSSNPTSPPPSKPPRSQQPATGGLSELDNLLAMLNDTQRTIEESNDKPPSSEVIRPSVADFMDELTEVEQQVSDVGGMRSPKAGASAQRVNITASTATQELDDLMANLSNFEPTDNQDKGDYDKPAKAGQKPKSAMDDLSSMLGSLSQDMTRHGVDIAAKGICAACNKPILAKVVSALGRQWHPEHFTCASCDLELGSTTYYESNGRPYCEKDYHELYAPRCAYCNGPILERVMRALDKTWHPEHFFCSLCGKHFGPEGFHEKDFKAFCRECYYEKFAPHCKRCDKAIMEGYVTALNAQWHPECFCCKICGVTFPRGNYYDHEGEPHCELHYHASRGTLCASCQKPVTGKSITAMAKKWHPEHFTCAFCLKLLNKGTFKEHRSNPYCQPCYIKLFG